MTTAIRDQLAQTVASLPDRPGVYLWRFMIARPFQGKGYGKQAIALVLRDLKARGLHELYTSYGQGPGSPEGLQALHPARWQDRQIGRGDEAKPGSKGVGPERRPRRGEHELPLVREHVNAREHVRPVR